MKYITDTLYNNHTSDYYITWQAMGGTKFLLHKNLITNTMVVWWDHRAVTEGMCMMKQQFQFKRRYMQSRPSNEVSSGEVSSHPSKTLICQSHTRGRVTTCLLSDLTRKGLPILPLHAYQTVTD